MELSQRPGCQSVIPGVLPQSRRGTGLNDPEATLFAILFTRRLDRVLAGFEGKCACARR